jgi:superfamily I DNA/RNA helicase
MYQLSHPEIRGFDAILFDESQDANPVILDIVRRQKMRKVWVGDQHQSIYEFTGAVNTIEGLIEQGIPALPLTQSFRFGPNVAELANRVLAMKYRYCRAKFRPGSIPEIIGAGSGKAEGSNAILCRSNVGVLQEALANRTADIYFADCLPYAYLMSMLDIYRLRMEQPITNRESQYFGYSTVQELKHEADLRGDVDTMRAITLLEKMGPDNFKGAVEALMEIAKNAKKTAAIHILTAHKAKGLEWPDVRLSNDFISSFVEKDGRMRKEVSEQEINLLYVAVTRARLSVSLPAELKQLMRVEDQYW